MPESFHPALHEPTADEGHRSVPVPRTGSQLRKFLAFAGPGFLVAVGYMDPGNWATDIAGGARYGYTLLSVVLISSLMAIVLQALSARLGIVTGQDLAQACRAHFGRRTGHVLWVLAEIAIIATDLAEVIGSAVALQLLFGLPLLVGVVITVLDVFVVLWLNHKGVRGVEAVVASLVALIGLCFAIELFLSRPEWSGVLAGFVPSPEIIRTPGMLLIAIGILGATVMPHNLYLHSSIVQTRAFERTSDGKREAIRFATLDSSLALGGSLFINAAILILSASTFHRAGLFEVAEIQDAHRLLAPLLGTGLSSTLFAIALLASGQNSTLTGTMAGQIVMDGFLKLRMRPVIRRLITRGLAVIPAMLVIALVGENSVTDLLVLSQVILSMQLSFAVFPLVAFTSDRRKMGEFVSPGWLKALAWAIAIVIAGLNAYLLIQLLSGAG
ncbi:MAG: Nramp family divalent metal transporter [Thermoflexales bacterium]|nr:Nramp family divalent metal transporter [Thermoflexales bacterium]